VKMAAGCFIKRWALLCGLLSTTQAVVLGTKLAPAAMQSCVARFRPRAAPAHRHTTRCPHPRCLLNDDADAPDDKGDSLFAELRAEVGRRSREGASLGKFAAMQSYGPHHTTTPREVVEFVITELQRGNISQAFAFSAIPVTKRGTHKSSTDWSRRMAWEKAQIIGGAPSGQHHDSEGFEAMVRDKYGALLNTDVFRFLGDATPWQQKNGMEKMTAEKEYLVEVKTKKDDHLLFKFRLVYDWLLYCHLVTSVSMLSASTSKHFPGAEDVSIDI